MRVPLPSCGLPDLVHQPVTGVAAGVTLAVGYYGTDIGQSRCGGGQKICDDRVMLKLSRKF
jgi:hypothetical protein